MNNRHNIDVLLYMYMSLVGKELIHLFINFGQHTHTCKVYVVMQVEVPIGLR